MFPTRVKCLQRLLQLKHTCWCPTSLGKAPYSRLVLGIETSCDDTGAAVLDETGAILGESLHSQKEVHLRTGGIIPTVAQQLHRESIERVVQEALERSGVDPSRLSAVATTVRPGLGLSLAVGLEFSRRFVRRHNKPFIPIHHMEAHALTVRMLRPVAFPFLVLLVSGGHSLLAVARGVDDFLLLGHALDEAPGDTLDKVARRLSLINHPQCSSMSGGQAIELLAKDGDRTRFPFRTPMGKTYDCCFSFAGLRSQINRTIMKSEAEEGMRTSKVLSGGVASNQYIRKALATITDATALSLLCPPAKFCTDNGVMIAWNGVERLREGKGILPPDVDVSYEPKAQLGVDMMAEVKAAAIRTPSVRMKIPR
ncbi:putative tRNA N6-adenosine threonylcarbamoyltransferase, mitochondrial [Liparis tanakae]|uniref:N(6)-L-threonylcarbamoyladenine synthase n=1 Tax=Liparis tanakae TaxID=230148 RepID=A0A4Z2G3P7_9TELE|nr:putative tRNA N6-adenosine threonylcarbamoyltransferase, mitochondrial [Liparis tanakae]